MADLLGAITLKTIKSPPRKPSPLEWWPAWSGAGSHSCRVQEHSSSVHVQKTLFTLAPHLWLLHSLCHGPWVSGRRAGAIQPPSHLWLDTPQQLTLSLDQWWISTWTAPPPLLRGALNTAATWLPSTLKTYEKMSSRFLWPLISTDRLLHAEHCPKLFSHLSAHLDVWEITTVRPLETEKLRHTEKEVTGPRLQLRGQTREH